MPMASMPYNIPQITLDSTLADYYAEGNESGEVIHLVASFPRGLYRENQRYIYHDDEMTQLTTTISPIHDPSRAKVARIYRDLSAQKFSFCAGDMSVMLFHGEADNESSMEDFRKSIDASLSVLAPSQRPKLTIFRKPSEVRLKGERTKLAVRLPLDDLRAHTHIIDPDLHYELLSKRGLALAKTSFPTPISQILDLCCEHLECKVEILGSGKGFCKEFPSEEEMDAWSSQTINAVSKLKIPYVLKVQQSTGSQGTFIVKTEEDHEVLKGKLPAILDYNRARTNKNNIHLRPATLVISDLIHARTGPGPNNWAISFFAQRDGAPAFIGCAEQVMSAHNLWLGGSITYSHQQGYQARFTDVMTKVCCFLHRYGYYGAVGIDILEDGEGKLWVVDLNVRPPGSLVLGLLRGFLEERGLDFAVFVASRRFSVSKDELCVKFAREFAEGRLILNAWVDDDEEAGGWATLVIAGEDEVTAKALCGKLEDG